MATAESADQAEAKSQKLLLNGSHGQDPSTGTMFCCLPGTIMGNFLASRAIETPISILMWGSWVIIFGLIFLPYYWRIPIVTVGLACYVCLNYSEIAGSSASGFKTENRGHSGAHSRPTFPCCCVKALLGTPTAAP